MNQHSDHSRTKHHPFRMPRLAGVHGMSWVLLILCLFFSLATLHEQESSRSADTAELARRIIRGANDKQGIVILAEDNQRGRMFVEILEKELAEEHIKTRVLFCETPREVRLSLSKLLEKHGSVSVIATCKPLADWPILKNPASIDHRLGESRIFALRSHRWPNFLKVENIINIADQITVIAILAIGMTLVIISGGIDLSVGSLIALGAVASTLMIQNLAGGTSASTTGLIACSLGGILICAVVGSFSGVAVACLEIPPFIATLAVMLMASGLAYILSAGQSVYQLPDAYMWLGRGYILPYVPVAVALMCTLYFITNLIMKHVTVGRCIYAVGGNLEAARLSGINIRLILIMVYTLSGALAGLGGIIISSQLKCGSPTYGQMYELYAIAAVVVGGASLSGGEGRIFGTLIGALIIAVIQNGMNLLGIQSYTQKVVFGTLILAAVVLDMIKKRSIRINIFSLASASRADFRSVRES